MESQNKLFEAFKAAAKAEEQQPFAAQDKIWERIAAQLDQPKKKRFSIWRIGLIAASLVLLIGLALSWNVLFNNESTIVKNTDSQNPQSENKVIIQNNISNQALPESTPIKEAKIAVITPQEGLPVVKDNEEPLKPIEEGVVTLESENGLVAQQDLTKLYNPNHKLNSLVKISQFQIQEPKLSSLPIANTPNTNNVVSGRVVDPIGTPIANAKVSVKGSNNFTTTDQNGNFSFVVPEDKGYLSISSIGNETSKIKLGNESFYKIVVAPDNSNVAILDNIENGQIKPNMENHSIQNVVPNAFSKKNSGSKNLDQLASKTRNQGDLFTLLKAYDDNSDFFLILVNGVSFNGGLNDIDYSKIKEMHFVNDASSKALYGSRAKNGIILITLKSDKKKKR